jgi:hypothetical protein
MQADLNGDVPSRPDIRDACSDPRVPTMIPYHIHIFPTRPPLYVAYLTGFIGYTAGTFIPDEIHVFATRLATYVTSDSTSTTVNVKITNR